MLHRDVKGRGPCVLLAVGVRPVVEKEFRYVVMSQTSCDVEGH